MDLDSLAGMEAALVALCDALDRTVADYRAALRGEAAADTEARRRYHRALLTLGTASLTAPLREAKARVAAEDHAATATLAGAEARGLRAALDALTLRVEVVRSLNATARADMARNLGG